MLVRIMAVPELAVLDLGDGVLRYVDRASGAWARIVGDEVVEGGAGGVREAIEDVYTMVGTHPAFPSTAAGHSSFEWLRDGALLVWRFEWERPGPPSAFSVIGHDDAVETCSMLYTDERGVARIYQVSLEGDVWKLWRDSPDFSQRITGTFSEDGNTISSHGELSRDGSNWEPDLSVTYTRRR